MSLEQDRADIMNVLAAYAFSIDGHHFDDLRSVFTADCRVSYNRVPLEPGVDHVIAHVSGLAGMPQSQHIFGAPSITIEGDTARARSYAVAHLVQVAPGTETGHTVTSRGLSYTDELVRTADGWRIATRVHECYWQVVAPTPWPVGAR
jgi:hypothetical protein